MAEEEDKQEEKFEFTSEGEALGYISLDQARVLAIEHARDNTDFYGPEYAGIRLIWEVTNADASEDHYDIRLSFRSVSHRQRDVGEEQLIFDKTGELRVRQLLREPTSLARRDRRRPSIALWWGAGAVVLGVVAVFTIAMIGPSGGDAGVAGEAPAPLPLSAEATALYIAGFDHYEQGEYAQAITAYGAAVRLEPESAGIYYNRGLAHARLGQYQEAVDNFREAIRRDPQYAEAFLNRGMSYARLGREEEASQDFLKATALRPQRE